jgi:uncharacterized protein
MTTTPPEYRAFIRHVLLDEAKPVHKFGHQPRLYRLCKEIGHGLEYDDDVVFAAAWCHDIGVFEGNRPSDVQELLQWDHVKYAVQRTGELLARTDFPPGKVTHVMDVIRQHQPQDVPATIEAIILRDADILEQLGAIGVLRTAAKLGSDTRFLRFTDARDYLRRQLSSLPAKLQLTPSRALAIPRVRVLENFLDCLDAEAGDMLG